MSILKGSFDGTKFDQVQGFRISAAFTPGHGFGGHFYVYLLDYLEAKSRFSDEMKVLDAGSPPTPRRGTLELASSDFTYTFENIELSDAELGATRARRYRLLEFRFPHEREQLVPSVRVSSRWEKDASLKEGRLGEDYMYSVGAGKEHLLGFRARLTPFDTNVLRFSGRRTKSTSFLEKIMDAAKSQADGRMTPFTVNFSPADVPVTQENCRRAYIVESHGYFTKQPVPALSRIGANADPAYARVRLDDFLPIDLVHHNEANFPDTENWMENNDVVETGTFVFQNTETHKFNTLAIK